MVPQPREPAPKTDHRIDLRPKFERGQEIKFKLEVSNTSQQPAVDIDVLDDPDSKPRPIGVLHLVKQRSFFVIAGCP